MKPHKPVKLSSSINRAKMLIAKDLGWLEGYPDSGGGWISAPTGHVEQHIVISRGDLRKATYTITKLRNDFPRALPRLVGDVDVWFNLHKTLINSLKPDTLAADKLPQSAVDIHPEYKTSDRNKARKLIRESPSLRSFIDTTSWYFWLKPKQLGTALKWIEENKTDFQTIVKVYRYPQANGVATRLLAVKSRHGVTRANGLLALLSSELLCGVATHGARQYIKRLRTHVSDHRGTAPTPSDRNQEWKKQTALWMQWLTIQNGRVARTALDTLALILCSTDVNAWRIWWARALETSISCKKTRLAKVNYEYLLRSIKDHPPELPTKLFFEVLEQYSSRTNNELHRAIRSALAEFPERLGTWPIRLTLLMQWNSQIAYASQRESRLLVTIIKEFANYAVTREKLRTALWTLNVTEPDWTENHWRYPLYQIDSMLLREMKTKGQIRSFYKSLACIDNNPKTKFQSGDTATIITLARVLESPEQCAIAFHNLKQAQLNRTPYPDVIEQAIKISDDELVHFVELVEILYHFVEASSDGTAILPLISEFWSKALGDDLRAAVIDGYLPQLHAAACKARVVTRPGGKIQAPGLSENRNTSSWIANYPATLHAPLMQLATTHADAQAIAARILQKDFPDPVRMKKELRVLHQKSAQAETNYISSRIKTLESRLKSPAVPGAGRLRNLERKLLKATVKAKINGWREKIDSEYNGYLISILKCNSLPEWATDEKLPQLLSPLSDLRPSMRRLALQILHNRAGQPPWDMRSRADNKRFIQSMHELDINMEVWLDDAPVITKVHKQKTIEFTLERDPLEILSMGAHFQTCLSPGDFNYFSVFANAADINKQVLYGRDTISGKVAARCLLALTDTGAVVKFQPYRHDRELNFEDISSEYVTLLASNMNTVANRYGRISKLIASDWYDDGVMDIEERFSELSGDRVSQKLKTSQLHEVQQFLQDEIAPLKFDEFTLPRIFSLSVFDERPELVLPFFTFVDNNTRLSDETLVRTAKILGKCKRFNEIQRIMPRLIKIVLADGRYYRGNRNTDILHLLLPVSASTVLWLLKKTRGAGIRKWEHETDSERLYLGALANLQLNRRKMAQRLLEKAISLTNGHTKKWYKSELDKITATT